MKVSVIDLGFNSLKLVSYEVSHDSTSFYAYDQESVAARLGEGLSQTGFLGSEPIRRAINGLKFFKEINELYGVRHCLPVATSAVREAANRDQFLDQAHLETGFKFKVLSGKEEALYSYSGAVRALGESDILFFDIGGGSLEFVYSADQKIRKILSLPLGGLRLTELYADRDGSFRGKAYSRMERRISDLLPARSELLLREDTVLVGVGGNLRALARWDQQLRDYPLNKIHNYSMKLQSIEEMRKDLSQLNTREISEIEVIGKDRAETIAAGSLVIELIMKKLGFPRVTVSTHGLRDGVLASFLEDPLGYHRGSLAKTMHPLARMARDQKYDPSVRRFLETLEAYDLIDEREMQIVFLSLKWLTGEASTTRPESLFALIMDEESPLFHRDQLLGALAVIELRKARSYRWFYSRYRALLKPRNEKNVERLAAIARFLEIVIRTDSKIKVSFEERGARISITLLRTIPEEPESRRSDFPIMLLNQAATDLARELDRFIDYKVKNARKVSSGSTGEDLQEEDEAAVEHKATSSVGDNTSQRETETHGSSASAK